MGSGSLLRNNDPTMSSEAPPRSRCNRRKNWDGLSSLSSSFISACRTRWSFLCTVRFRHSCLKVVNGSGRFKAFGRKSLKSASASSGIALRAMRKNHSSGSAELKIGTVRVVETELLEGCPASFMLRRDGIMVSITHGSPNVVDNNDKEQSYERSILYVRTLSIPCIIFTSDNSESRVVSNRCGGLSLHTRKQKKYSVVVPKYIFSVQHVSILTLVKVKIRCRSVMCINLEVTNAISKKDHVDSPFH
ncbi:hypothetical protein T12_1114 [Trichinella patagoniensis]|uniref:Uncharacterized protein n=1 Tax=Trichinella patagoniensis TaxID=990121 RepID=A0A0V0ZB13_9BILA|nr:hypothetical protein T12_1114 [Trichinella patagoniensis]